MKYPLTPALKLAVVSLAGLTSYCHQKSYTMDQIWHGCENFGLGSTEDLSICLT